MKIILHIGAPKTGTSSIQVTLNRSRKLLAERGIRYPQMPGTNRHSLLAVPFLDAVPREFWPRYGRDKAEVDKAAMEAWQDIANLEGMPTLILSGETFINLRDGQGLCAVFQRLFPGAEIEILCYLRDPRSAFPSDLQQVLKASHRLPEQLHRPVVPALRRFGKIGKITLLEFGADAVSDFAARFLPAGMPLNRPDARDNVSMSAEGAQILQSFRLAAFPDQPNVMNDTTKRVLDALASAEAALGGVGYFGKPTLRHEIPGAIIAAAQADLAALEDEFGFRFGDPALYGKGTPLAYRADMSVSDVLNVDPAKLSQLHGAVLAVLAASDETSHLGSVQ